MKMGVVAPRIETCYPQIVCKGRFLFGGISPRSKLTTVACMHHELLRKVPYHDLGADYLDCLNKDVVEKKLVKRLEALGNKVMREPVL